VLSLPPATPLAPQMLFCDVGATTLVAEPEDVKMLPVTRHACVPLTPSALTVRQINQPYHPPHVASRQLSSISIDLNRVDGLHLEKLAAQAHRCLISVVYLQMSFSACSLVNRQSLTALCTSLRVVLVSIRDALQSPPAHFESDIQTIGHLWLNKFRNVISSLERNVNQFSLFAEYIGRRTPRANKIGGRLDKAHAFLQKFEDLYSRIMHFYDRARLLKLRATLESLQQKAREEKEAERRRRRAFTSTWAEGRSRWKSVKEQYMEELHASGGFRTRTGRPRGRSEGYQPLLHSFGLF